LLYDIKAKMYVGDLREQREGVDIVSKKENVDAD
jgi:hypothetical protein